jgi:hypothetical protein
MATGAAATFAGALFGIALISRIPIGALDAWKQRSFRRLPLARFLTFVVAATAYAFASANGGPPRWHAGLTSCAWLSLLVPGLDAIAILAVLMRRGIPEMRNPATVISELVAPAFPGSKPATSRRFWR